VWLILTVSLLFVLACPKEPARVNMVLAASPNVNTDAGGQPLSVVVRVYQLKDKGRLESADYNAIWKADRETLSDDFLDRQERIVQPGTQEMLEVRANPMATYLGIVALFRNPSGDSWRRVVPIKGKAQKISLSLREQSIELNSVGK
jgi:type VI secretion system protein VasD